MNINTIIIYAKLECPVGCGYCFEDPAAPKLKYNKEAMIATLKATIEQMKNLSRPPTVSLHGGEVLSLPIKDFRYFVKSISEIKIKNSNTHLIPSMQTSLFGLTEDHIKIIQKYMYSIGISIDGPPEFNILRGPRDKNANKRYQKQIIENIGKLRKAGIKFGPISVMSKVNASPDKIERLIAWSLENEFIDGRFNPMFAPVHHPALAEYELSVDELRNAFMKLADAHFSQPKKFQPQILMEVRKNLLGQGIAVCFLSGCDYMYTRCTSILPDGNLSRCDRCFESGYYYQPPEENNIRRTALSQSDCIRPDGKLCRYFDICSGGCPGEGIGGDFRRKTKYCEAIYSLYEVMEKHMRAAYEPNVTFSTEVKNYYTDYYQQGRILNEPRQSSGCGCGGR